MVKQLKFKFESNLPHQKEAVDSVVNLFKGFSQEIGGFQLGYDVIPNIKEFYDFDEEWLHGNYSDVVNYNNELKKAAGLQPDLPLKLSLDYEDGLMLKGTGDKSVRFPVFTIEMETGTGKTYVYLRTVHELKRLYGFRKFIVIVPSVAIYEGTITAFKQTYEHFRTLYENENIHLTDYDGQKISRVRNFANSSFTEIMVMTIDSFNKASNLIYKPTDRLQGEWLPMQYLQATRPILILDESQNYVSPTSREAIRTLNPLFAVNYSATPKSKPNLIYRLSPVDAFRHSLVKKIKVMGVTQQHNLNDPNLSLVIEGINNEQGLPTATVSAYTLVDGVKKKRSIKLKKNDNLYQKTNNEDFKGFIVEEINVTKNEITFTNQSVLNNAGGEGISLSKEEVFRVQLEETIKFHFERQSALLNRGIKVLSLIFIDRVANYNGETPIIKRIFEEEFERFKIMDAHFSKFKAEEVHKGYFAQKRDYTYLDSFETKGMAQTEKEKVREAEKKAFRLIMKDKEQLLSFEEKTSFIFAHSALKEGWDNPNVFCICTLNTTRSEPKKRQEIGRGLRLARNSEGELVKEDGVNILTVIANESYENYVNTLQTEYAETGDVAPPKPTKAKRDWAKRNDSVYKSSDFKIFWDNLSKKTEYTINIDTPELIQQCIKRLNSDKVTFPKPQIVISQGEFVISDYHIELLELKHGKAKIHIAITDTNGKNVSIKGWYPVGYDFGRKTKDKNLSGYKIMPSDYQNGNYIDFGNGVRLFKDQPIAFSGDPGSVENQRAVKQTRDEYPVFNLIERASKNLSLTRPTVLSIFKGMDDNKKEAIFRNPEGFSNAFIGEIGEQLANHVADKIEYILTGELEQYNMEELFPSEKDFPQRELIDGSDHSLYEKIQTDSDVERNFIQWRVQDDDKKGRIICYFKFPTTYKIRIPKVIQNYNPDWGIIRLADDGKTKVQLVRETKGSMNPNLLQYPNEKRKIQCAKKHFVAIGVKYRQVNDQLIAYWEEENQDMLDDIK